MRLEAKMKLTRGLGKTLLTWSVLSITSGILLYLTPFLFIQGVGLQAIIWGIIDAVIALFTLYKQSKQDLDKISMVLRINVGLDIIYQIIGFLLLVFLWQDLFIAGNGLGVIIQGAFLLVLDLYYYSKFRQLNAISQN